MSTVRGVTISLLYLLLVLRSASMRATIKSWGHHDKINVRLAFLISKFGFIQKYWFFYKVLGQIKGLWICAYMGICLLSIMWLRIFEVWTPGYLYWIKLQKKPHDMYIHNLDPMRSNYSITQTLTLIQALTLRASCYPMGRILNLFQVMCDDLKTYRFMLVSVVQFSTRVNS